MDQWFTEDGRNFGMKSVVSNFLDYGVATYTQCYRRLWSTNKRQRLECCRERHQWNEEWNNVVFKKKKILAFERHVVDCTVVLMTWGTIVTFNICYIDVFLRPSLLPYIQELPKTLLEQDNARPHIAWRLSNTELFSTFHINLLPWSSGSSYLPPIEHVWDVMGVRISQLTPSR